MNQSNISKHTSTAQEALRSFLATLLGAEAPLRINDPVGIEFSHANMQSKAYLVLTAGTSAKNRFAVILDPRWLPLLSKSMLGEPIEIGEPGADDLLRELAAQAYGALRTQFSSSGITLQEVMFELLESGSDMDQSQYHNTLAEVSFNMELDGESLGGFVMLPVHEGSEKSASSSGQKSASTAAMQAANVPSELRGRSSSQGGPAVNVSAASFQDLGAEVVGGDGSSGSFRILAEVELEITVELTM